MAEQEKKYTTYPEGIYSLEIIGNTITQKKLEGTDQPDPNSSPYVLIKAKVLSLKKSKNGAATPNLVFGGYRDVSVFFDNPDRVQDSVDFLKAAGFRGPKIEVLKDGHPNHLSLKGFVFDANCVNKPYNGKVYDRFYFMRVGDGSGKPKWREGIGNVSQTKLMGLNALWNSANTGIPSASHIQAASEPPPFAPDSAKVDSMDFNSWD